MENISEIRRKNLEKARQALRNRKPKNVITRIRGMTTEEIRREIPRAVYEGILLSLDIMVNDFLRSKNDKVKMEASVELMSLLSDASFMKNIQTLLKETESATPKVEWLTDEDSIQATSGSVRNTEGA